MSVPSSCSPCGPSRSIPPSSSGSRAPVNCSTIAGQEITCDGLSGRRGRPRPHLSGCVRSSRGQLWSRGGERCRPATPGATSEPELPHALDLLLLPRAGTLLEVTGEGTDHALLTQTDD